MEMFSTLTLTANWFRFSVPLYVLVSFRFVSLLIPVLNMENEKIVLLNVPKDRKFN